MRLIDLVEGKWHLLPVKRLRDDDTVDDLQQHHVEETSVLTGLVRWLAVRVLEKDDLLARWARFIVDSDDMNRHGRDRFSIHIGDREVCLRCGVADEARAVLASREGGDDVISSLRADVAQQKESRARELHALHACIQERDALVAAVTRFLHRVDYLAEGATPRAPMCAQMLDDKPEEKLMARLVFRYTNARGHRIICAAGRAVIELATGRWAGDGVAAGESECPLLPDEAAALAWVTRAS